MPNVVQNPFSNTPTNVPASLQGGEIAINHADRKIFMRGPGGAVEDIATWMPSGGGGSGFFSSFTGNGSTTNFTLAASVSAATDILVFINGVHQRPTTHYNVSGTTLTFVTAPLASSAIVAVKPAGSTGATGAAGSQKISINAYIGESPLANEVLAKVIFDHNVTLVQADSSAHADVAATASYTISITKNGVSAGTVVWGVGATTATVTLTTTSFAPGDILRLVGAASADATLANITVMLSGSRI